MSDRSTADFLATIPLLEGREWTDLVDLAGVLRRRTVQEGELLWRQGDKARELVFIIEGGLSVSLHVPGDRAVLVLARDPFEQLFKGEDAVSRVFLDLILRELVATLRQTLRPHARLAASV